MQVNVASLERERKVEPPVKTFQMITAKQKRMKCSKSNYHIWATRSISIIFCLSDDGVLLKLHLFAKCVLLTN